MEQCEVSSGVLKQGSRWCPVIWLVQCNVTVRPMMNIIYHEPCCLTWSRESSTQ